MITIGPFRITEIEAIQVVLEKNSVPFEVFADEDVRDQAMAQFNEMASKTRGGAGQLDLRYIFFEIDPAHFDKARVDLEKFGITPPTDGRFELGEE